MSDAHVSAATTRSYGHSRRDLDLLRTYFRYFPVERGKWRVWDWATRKGLLKVNGAVVDTTRYGFTMRLHLNEFIDRFIYYWGCWEPDESWLLTNIVRGGDHFVDVGANVGYFTLLASLLVGPAGHVTSFEPCPVTFQRLVNHIHINNVRNVSAYQHACSNTEGMVTVHTVATNNPGASTLRNVGGAADTCSVAAVRLDSVLSKTVQYRLVKIDVEGAEMHVIEGMQELLDAGKIDAILCEVTDQFLRQLGKNAKQLFFRLREAGFEPYQVGHRKLFRTDVETINDVQANVLFVSERLEMTL